MSGNLDGGRAAKELKRLRAEASSPEVRRQRPTHKAWQAKADALASRINARAIR
jgi:hypothetical protein